MAYKYYQGFFTPIHKEKYVGDINNIVYRSSWEKKLFIELDNNINVLQWSSEGLAIPYFNPIDQKTHRYFPDVIFTSKLADNSIKTYMVEVKPYNQTQPPTQKRKTKNFINESITYTINQAKWKFADKFCQENGWIFKIITEKELNF